MNVTLVENNSMDLLKEIQCSRDLNVKSIVIMNTNEALLELLEHGFETDLIITPIEALEKDISGLELCRRLKVKGYKMPIILISSKNNFLLEKQAFENGALGVINKPYTKCDLACWIKSASSISSFRKKALLTLSA